MSQEFQYHCWTENKRLLWFIGATLAVILTFQHFELRYSDIISSVSSAQEVLVSGNATAKESGTVSKILYLDGLNSTSRDDSHENVTDLGGEETANEVIGTVSPPSMAPVYSSTNSNPVIPNVTSLGGEGVANENIGSVSPPTMDLVIPRTHANESTSKVNDVAVPSVQNSEVKQQNDYLALNDNVSIVNVAESIESPLIPTSEVVSLSEMNDLLTRSWSTPNKKPLWFSAVDEELPAIKWKIENAPIIKDDPVLFASLYRNISMFKRSYELMEKTLKVFVYKEGNRPIFHKWLLRGIYASEGWFMKLLESSRQFVTLDPRKAHLFYLPFSSVYLEETVYEQNSHTFDKLIRYLKNYLDMISTRHPFWNRTEGADHFFVACHDWAPTETKDYMSNCIRALCNADAKEGFRFGKDASLPETRVIVPRKPLKDLGGKPASKRSILAFFAGKMHGYVRPILLQHWENKDPDMKIFGKLRKTKGKGKMNYIQYMKSSKYCICAKGYEVNSPRVVEAIFYGCVPVIISDNFVPPFFETLNWESFAIFVLEKDIQDLKNILLSISEERYRQIQMRVKKVQQHFLWHAKPQKYDIFHMILHSIWYNRVFQS